MSSLRITPSPLQVDSDSFRTLDSMSHAAFGDKLDRKRLWFRYAGTLFSVRGRYEYVVDLKHAVHRVLGDDICPSPHGVVIRLANGRVADGDELMSNCITQAYYLPRRVAGSLTLDVEVESLDRLKRRLLRAHSAAAISNEGGSASWTESVDAMEHLSGVADTMKAQGVPLVSPRGFAYKDDDSLYPSVGQPIAHPPSLPPPRAKSARPMQANRPHWNGDEPPATAHGEASSSSSSAASPPTRRSDLPRPLSALENSPVPRPRFMDAATPSPARLLKSAPPQADAGEQAASPPPAASRWLSSRALVASSPHLNAMASALQNLSHVADASGDLQRQAASHVTTAARSLRDAVMLAAMDAAMQSAPVDVSGWSMIAVACVPSRAVDVVAAMLLGVLFLARAASPTIPPLSLLDTLDLDGVKVTEDIQRLRFDGEFNVFVPLRPISGTEALVPSLSRRGVWIVGADMPRPSVDNDSTNESEKMPTKAAKTVAHVPLVDTPVDAPPAADSEPQLKALREEVAALRADATLAARAAAATTTMLAAAMTERDTSLRTLTTQSSHLSRLTMELETVQRQLADAAHSLAARDATRTCLRPSSRR